MVCDALWCCPSSVTATMPPTSSEVHAPFGSKKCLWCLWFHNQWLHRLTQTSSVMHWRKCMNQVQEVRVRAGWVVCHNSCHAQATLQSPYQTQTTPRWASYHSRQLDKDSYKQKIAKKVIGLHMRKTSDSPRGAKPIYFSNVAMAVTRVWVMTFKMAGRERYPKSSPILSSSKNSRSYTSKVTIQAWYQFKLLVIVKCGIFRIVIGEILPYYILKDNLYEIRE